MANSLLRKGSPIRASVRVVCSELYNSENSLPALFNPASLKHHYKAVVGKGTPVGWSQQIKQYSHSEDAPFQLQFYFSMLKSARVAQQVAFTGPQAIAWYHQFLFPKQLGEAPPLMLLVWPNTLTMIVCVEEIETDYELWDADLQVRICTITLTVSEMRQNFRSQQDMLGEGFLGGCEFVGKEQAASWYKLGRSGPPLNLGTGGLKRK